ncbi:SHOCT domain-containing protein [Quadrisphaera sp. KR29]|uniref:SHOCT domain-containing protein n=1 Tax=Quadrisphaera sp. KR29 TaxID=3461391 RepID=UPI0040446EC2
MDSLLTHPFTASLTSVAASTATDPRWGPGPWHGGGPGPWVLVPLLFWVLVIGAVVFTVRRRRSRSAEQVLREAYARGDVDEEGYRARLAVLRSTRR